jgi:hypothetical protein
MPFSNLAARPREDHPARPANPLAPPFYPIGLLPTMQGLLAAVADLETRYEIEREQIEQGPGSEGRWRYHRLTGNFPSFGGVPSAKKAPS